MHFFFDIATAPLARQVVTIIGSISGVRPTAIETANRNAPCQFPLVKPFRKSTTGTMTSMKRISTQETELTPFSKPVAGLGASSEPAMPPSTVSSPTARTTATAVPETMLLPKKASAGFSSRVSQDEAAADFSSGSLSPVRAAWLMKRSFERRMRTSAGTMSPAARWTMSPTASSSSGSSAFPAGSRSTAAVVRTISLSRAAALPERVS